VFELSIGVQLLSKDIQKPFYLFIIALMELVWPAVEEMQPCVFGTFTQKLQSSLVKDTRNGFFALPGLPMARRLPLEVWTHDYVSGMGKPESSTKS
jgi:hypothetical protein